MHYFLSLALAVSPVSFDRVRPRIPTVVEKRSAEELRQDVEASLREFEAKKREFCAKIKASSFPSRF
jgi:hypothetical protein